MICKNLVVGIFGGPLGGANEFYAPYLRCNTVEMITIEGVNILCKGPSPYFYQDFENAKIIIDPNTFTLGENVILWMTPLTN